jgi:2-polyprenyl-6-methoxyphenol hydroxylase-like FAD-dependent oxidoreductase
MVIVDDHSRRLATIPGEFTGGDVEILRGDLATLLYDRTTGDSEYRFGDSITTLTQTESGVEVAFQQAAPRTFDLVIGADGIHSNVRRLAFGPEERFVRFLWYYYAVAGGWGADAAAEPSTQRGKGLIYNVPGRLAWVGAYVLAGELAAADGDHYVAFARYDHQLHQYAKIARKGNAGPFLALPTPARIRLRNWTFRFSLPLRLMMKVTNRYATDIDLRDYPQEVKHSA